MKKISKTSLYCILCIAVTGCAKHDPILPGDRVSIFGDELVVQDKPVSKDILKRAASTEIVPIAPDSNYTQSSDNIITDASGRKIFSGFPTVARVHGNREIVSHKGYIYAGLSTGELVKIASKSRELKWATDLFKTTAITGGSEIMDIVAPIIIDGSYIFAGGLGGAFCKLKDSTGAKVWCNWIGVATPFSVYGELAFVIGTDNYLYVINTAQGDIYSRMPTKCTSRPELIQEGDDFFVQCMGKKMEKIKL